MKPRGDYSYDHSKQRAKERYGITLTRKDYDHLCDRIRRKNQVREVSTEKNGEDVQTLFEIGYKGQILLAVYSGARDRITTFLPPIDFAKIDRNECVHCPGELRVVKVQKSCKSCKAVYILEAKGYKIYRR